MGRSSLPQLIRIRRKFEHPQIDDIDGEVRRAMQQVRQLLKPGMNVAIAAGSRGIAHIEVIIRSTVQCIEEAGCRAFVFPAMGSHGGATAEGQKKVLASYGILADRIGAPVLSSMKVVELPGGNFPHRVYMDKYAYESDGVVLINRIKGHTDFYGEIESGLLKMAVIGLGKKRGAEEIHGHGIDGLRELIIPTARHILKTGKILFGLGIIENAYGATAFLEAIPAEMIEDEERRLLAVAKDYTPSIPVNILDILVIDAFGKNISGTGVDTKVIGRIGIHGVEEPETPRIRTIVLCDLTDESHGNAIGTGLADIITRRVFEKVDFRVTAENVVTSTFLERGKLPLVAETDTTALEYALRSLGLCNCEKVRLIRIKNTLNLSDLFVSASAYEQIREREDVEVMGEFIPPVNDQDKLIPW